MSWQPIETAPKDGEWFLAASSNKVTVEIVRYDYEADGCGALWFDGVGFYKLSNFTHWMPLPEPPK